VLPIDPTSTSLMKDTPMNTLKLVALTATLLLITIAAGTSGLAKKSSTLERRVETRCGWFSNPTPGNAWLDDRDGQWVIGTQGGHQAEGDWPEFKANQWVRTNGNYGYGCACMNVVVNHKTSYVLEIKSARARPLAACRKDPSLKEPR